MCVCPSANSALSFNWIYSDCPHTKLAPGPAINSPSPAEPRPHFGSRRFKVISSYAGEDVTGPAHNTPSRFVVIGSNWACVCVCVSSLRRQRLCRRVWCRWGIKPESFYPGPTWLWDSAAVYRPQRVRTHKLTDRQIHWEYPLLGNWSIFHLFRCLKRKGYHSW